MSQQLIPINGGVEQVQTTIVAQQIQQLSPQYVRVNNLQPRPTQWIPDGRPIYRRLPSVSETYQIDFFNVVSPPNTAVAAELQDIGYVYVAPGNTLVNNTCKVTASETKNSLLVEGGNVVWAYGRTEVLPALIDIRELALRSGRYVLAYELEYDDQPRPMQYRVEDFLLTGQTLTLDSSTDSILGWKYRTENAFLDSSVYWSSTDASYTAGPPPSTTFLTWVSSQTSAYTKLILRQPADFFVNTTVTATLELLSNGAWVPVDTAIPTYNENNQAEYIFELSNPSFVKGWRVKWETSTGVTPDVKIQEILVSGTITLLEKPSGPSPLASLAIYAENQLPANFTYCTLAIVDINSEAQVEAIKDARELIFRDYQPIANWLTDFWDTNLINLYEQVEQYPVTWISPTTCLTQEYQNLTQYGIFLPGETPLASIVPN